MQNRINAMNMCAFNLVKSATLTFATVVSLATATQVSALDWYRWRGPDLNGISKETGWNPAALKGEPKILWKAEVGIGFSCFSVSKGKVYTTGNAEGKDSVFCFDAQTGKELWKHTYDCPLDAKFYEGGTSATPTVDGDVVFTLSKRGHMFCLEAATGKIIWNKNVAEESGATMPTWGFASSPVLDGDMVLVNVGKSGMALDKKSGKILWQSEKDAAGYSSAVPFDDGGKKLMSFFGAKALYAVDPKDGKVVWSHPWKTQYDVNAADAIFKGNQVFVSASYGSGGAVIEFSNGQTKELWKNKTMRNHFNSCVLVKDHIYGVTGQSGQKSYLLCLDWKTGGTLWQEDIGLGSCMVADDKLIVLGEKGELIIAPVDPTGFKPISRAQVLGGKCWTTPVLSNGKIYCRNAQGSVVCVDVEMKK